ncbi:unnamed protein product [Adineta ricciae]|uniref:Uncharacterized protein n=1 Tax=Adineta ricciae TaxID=249248 RepID=A0A813MSF6_ADIRI|nr:unnamed protein product [Adineta ricciae]CAF1223585.1 unnamed protein product [Adineta ricciae]
MLQDYRRQRKIKSLPLKPKVDQNLKQCDSNLSVITDISLLSVSNSSMDQPDENEISDDSSSSQESVSIESLSDEEEPRAKQNDLDSYIFDKHLNRIPSTVSRLTETNADQSVQGLLEKKKFRKSDYVEDYDPCSIQGPPYAEYIKQLRGAKKVIKPQQRQSPLIPVRTTRSEQLKLARQRSASNDRSDEFTRNSSAKLSQHNLSSNVQKQQPLTPAVNHISRLRTDGDHNNFRRAKSAQLCQTALCSGGPLRFSSLLLKQIQQDLQNEKAKYPPITSTLLHEHLRAPLTDRYKTKRIRRWLQKLVPTDYLEHNEYASNESTLSTNFTDRLNEEYGILSDDKTANNSERTLAEARRVLPIFRSEFHRKIEQYNLLLARLKSDLYIM